MKAIILYGPSGVGKTTLAKRLCQDGYYHCDADAFKLLFSKERTPLRSEIGERMCFHYAQELSQRRLPFLVEALSAHHVEVLKPFLVDLGYQVEEVSLVAGLGHCLRNDATRKGRQTGSAVVKEVYEKYLIRRGHVIDVNGLGPEEVYAKVTQVLSSA